MKPSIVAARYDSIEIFGADFIADHVNPRVMALFVHRLTPHGRSNARSVIKIGISIIIPPDAWAASVLRV